MSKPANTFIPPDEDPAAVSALRGEDLGENPASESEAQAAAAPEEPRTVFPCSVAQERFWLLDRLDPGISSYNVAVRWQLEGRVAGDVLEESWRALIDRHEILRTVFFESNGVATQRVLARMPFKIAEIDLSNLPPAAQRAEGDRIGILEARTPFDLEASPLLRVTLLRFSPTTAIILITTHQIVADGWSIGIMAREMGVIYDAVRAGKPVPLDPLSIQYADYSLWQLEWLRVRGTVAEEEYWTKQLAGVKPFKVIPDHPRPALPTTNGAIVSRVLSRDLTDKAQGLATERGATLFAVALAALAATLARFTGEDEVVIGTQVSDRDQVELESMVGQFVNSLVLRNDVAGNPSFAELISRLAETASQALEHRHIPIERLLGLVKGERSDANSVAISVNFIFQKTFIQNTTYADFTLIDLPSLPAGAIYDLNFFMVERPDGWRFSCQYNTDQFADATAHRLLRYVENVLADGVADSHTRTDDLKLGSAAVGPDGPEPAAAAAAPFQSIVALFQDRVRATPAAIAAVFGARQLSFAELDRASDRLAGVLRARGVAGGERVAVCAAPGLGLPLALLATLKVGASFTPLDPGEPPARRALLFAASGAKLVVVAKSPGIEAAQFDVPTVDAGVALTDSTATDVATTSTPTGPGGEVCAVFASTPLGPRLTPIAHADLAAMLVALRDQCALDAADVVLSATALGQDRAIADLLLPLVGGGRLVLAPAADANHGRHLAQLVEHSGATTLLAGSRALLALVASGWSPRGKLRVLAGAGDIDAPLAEQLLATGCELWSLYGHPLSGIWCAARPMATRTDLARLGKPLGNARLTVLDRALRPAPIGVVGSLHSGDAAARVATGDRARVTNSGEIELLGRADRQFIRDGRRIAPQEIEAVLCGYPEVADAVVAAGAGGAGFAVLVASIRGRDGDGSVPPSLIAQLRAGLEASLPPALVPSFAVRRAAPPAAAGGADGQPPSETERRLAAIWRSMLGIDAVDTEANFFELGGHSLLAARMLARVDGEFGRRIKLGTLFRAPTIRELARLIDEPNHRDFDFRQIVRVQPHGMKQPLIGVNNTGIYFGLAKRLGEEQPLTSLQLFDPSVKTDAMPRTLEEIAAGYVALIRLVQPQGPYSLMGWCVAGALAFEIACQLEAGGKQVSHLFLMDSWVPRYMARLPQPRRLVNEQTLRWQFIWEDLRHLVGGRQSLKRFIKNRMIVKRMERYIQERSSLNAAQRNAQASFANIEDYDQWLLQYLQDITGRYEPKNFRGRITLFRSKQEPTGLWFDRYAGWGPFAAAGVELIMLDGNHFTMFQDPGAAQMAQRIAAAMVEAGGARVSNS